MSGFKFYWHTIEVLINNLKPVTCHSGVSKTMSSLWRWIINTICFAHITVLWLHSGVAKDTKDKDMEIIIAKFDAILRRYVTFVSSIWLSKYYVVSQTHETRKVCVSWDIG